MTDTPIHLTSLLREQDWLRRLARSLVEAAAAEDLVQDTNRAALMSDALRTHDLPHERNRLRGWLRVIAKRRAAETWRQDMGRASREQEAARERGLELPDVASETERAELKRFLADAVMKLDDPLRDVIVLRYYEGQPHGQVATRLGITETLARKRASRGCAALRDQLDRRSGGDRSVWVSALAPWVGRAPRWSMPGFVAIAAVSIVLLVLGALWWRPFVPAAETVAPVAQVEIDGDVKLAGPSLAAPGKDASDGAERRDAADPPPSTPAKVRRRIAYPLPPVSERATLDVLAVWDDTDEPVPFERLFAFGPKTLSTDAGGRVRFTDLQAGYGGLGNFKGSHVNLKLDPGETRSLIFRIKREFSVRGRVVDEAGDAVADAEVLLLTGWFGRSGTLARTDIAGRFVLEGLSRGLIVAAAHPRFGVSNGQLINQYRIEQDAKSGGEVELVLAGGTGTLAGVVIDEEGVPMHGAQVQFTPELPPSTPESEKAPVSGAATDQAGRFELKLLRPGPGSWSVRTTFHGVNTGEVSITRSETTQVTLQLSPGLVVRGRVLNESTGEPVVRAMVAIGERGEPTIRAANTDDSGTFEIEHVQSAPARLWVEVLRETVYEQPFVPGTTDASALVLRVQSLTQAVSGRVLDDEGHPVVGYSVKAVGDRRVSFSAPTDSAGRFRIEHAAPDSSALEVYAPEPHDDRVLVRVTGCLPAPEPVEVIVPAQRLVTVAVVGRVVTPEGVALAEFEAELEAMDGSGWPFVKGQQSGRFRLDGVSVGQHALVIRAAGYVEFLRMIDVKAAETLDLGTITLERGSMFRLEVAFDAPPTEGSVELYEIREQHGGVQQRLYLGDVEGGFAEYGPVPVGPTRLLLDRRGFHKEFKLDVKPDGQTAETVRLKQPSQTNVTVEVASLGHRGEEGLEGDILTFGLSWRLLGGDGGVLQRSYRPRRQVYGRPLKLHGLEAGVEYTLEAEDVEGRSGSVRFQAGSDPVIVLRR